jgi:NADH:ubiquinone oxidoreductase subunit F (NADH-binding)/(2Fe-2S) ferredoxin/NAD-dependent dihydropyrimidine dehydrogenase PreA subunit
MGKIQVKELTKIAQNVKDEWKKYKAMIMICTDTACVSGKSYSVKQEFERIIKEAGKEDEFAVIPTGCMEFCSVGPIVVIRPEGVFYHRVKVEDVKEIFEKHLLGGQVVERLLFRDPAVKQLKEKIDEIQFFARQQFVVLRNNGLIDPEKIEHYIARGGYQSLAKVLEKNDPDWIIQEVYDAGLRGRGGGGFPTGLKWKLCKENVVKLKETPYVICNADEGDPGAFMDRSIIEANPHAVIEGMIIGGFALGAREGYVYIRQEYPSARRRLEIAINQAREKGFLGENIMGSDFSFDIHIHRGAGAFVCGEETALIASLEGKRGQPRPRPPFPAQAGYKGKPTVINNVETWATISVIIERGADWFASIGTGKKGDPFAGSTGTKIFCLAGDVKHTGLVEVPMGTTLREVIYDIGGGVAPGRKFKAVQIGGPSGGCIPEHLIDTPIDYETLKKSGAIMGSGGMVIMDNTACMVDVAKFFLKFTVSESCGKCTPCRVGLVRMLEVLEKISRGEGEEADIDFLVEMGESIKKTALCGLGQTAPNPVLTTIRYFRDEYLAHIKEKRCPAHVCVDLVKFEVQEDKCKKCGACYRVCPVGAITWEKGKVAYIDKDKCTKCKSCIKACNFDAIE